MPKVSVIVPIYNVGKYLRQALDSLVNQTLDDIEIVCIEDCSTDNSREILLEYAAKDDRIALILHEKNLGLGIARNSGIKAAKAPYIMFLDSDDWLELDACEKAYNQISKNDDDVVFFNSNTCDIDGNLIHPDKKLKPYKDYLDGTSFNLRSIKTNFVIRKIAVWTKIYRKNFLLDNNIFFPEITRGEDILFTVRVYLDEESCSVSNYTLINYRKSAEKSAKKELNYPVDAFGSIMQAYNCVVNKQDNKFILGHFLVYALTFALGHYSLLQSDNLFLNEKVYRMAHKFCSIIDKNHDVSKFYKKIDVVKFKLLVLSPSSFVFNRIYPLLADKATIDGKHIIFKIGIIRLKVRINGLKKNNKVGK